MNEKIISICIPTYNGAKSIKKTLESIISNIESIINEREKIEIVLSDDCSVDDTVKIIKEYVNRFEYIRLSQNDTNLGMDLNFKKIAFSAKGKYIWYCGQDDIFLDGVIKRVLDSIAINNDLGVVYINFSQYSEGEEKCICKSMLNRQLVKNSKVDFGKDLLFCGSDEYFSFFNDVPSFLPATIMKRDFWVSTDNNEYLGTCFIQYATILLNIKNANVFVITKPFIRGMIPLKGWQSNGDKLFSIHLGAIKAITLVFFDSRNPFPRDIYLEKKIFYLKHFLRVTIASQHLKFVFSKKNKDDLIFVYGKYWFYLYFLPIVFLVKLSPRFFINFLFFCKKLYGKYEK